MFGLGKKMGIILIVGILIAAAIGVALMSKYVVGDAEGNMATIYIEDVDGNVYSATADISPFTPGEAMMAGLSMSPRSYPLVAVAADGTATQVLTGLDSTKQYSVGFKVTGSVTLTSITSITASKCVMTVTGTNNEVGDGIGRNFLYGAQDVDYIIGIPIPITTSGGTFVAESGANNQHFTMVDTLALDHKFSGVQMNAPIEGRNIDKSDWHLNIKVCGVDSKGVERSTEININLTISAAFADGALQLVVSSVEGHTG